MPFHNALANGQSDTRSGILAAVQPLEHAENIVLVLAGNPLAVVRYTYNPLLTVLSGSDPNMGRFFASVLDGVADQILK